MEVEYKEYEGYEEYRSDEETPRCSSYSLYSFPNLPRCSSVLLVSPVSLVFLVFLPQTTSMQFHTEHLTFNTKKHRQFINITPEVTGALEKSGIREGMILVSAMHITAGVWVNDAEDGLLADIDEWLEKLAPYREDYRHHRTGETNGDSHLKSLIVHHQVIVPVTNGRLDFGPWQQVYYAEFDGQRPKRVIIKVMGE